MTINRTTIGADDYEAARRSIVWNARLPNRRPASIYRPSDPVEVGQLLRDVIPTGERIAVRAGGHNWLGASLRDGGALLDLRSLAGVRVDPATGVAHVGPGATNQIVADALEPIGLAFPIGHCPSVGLGGYLLSGGMGWNLHEWGFAADNIVAADVVLADGSETRVSAKSDPELFWALRGGSAAFPGVVTEFTLQTKPLPQIRSRSLIHPIDSLPEILAKLAGYLPANPGTEIAAIIRRPLWDRSLDPIATIACTTFGETAEEATERLEQAVRTLDLVAGSIRDSGIETVRFNELEGEGGWTEGLRYHADTSWATDPAREIGTAVVDAIRSAPSPESRVVIAFAHAPVRESETAFTAFGDMTVNFYATWTDETEDDDNIQWIRDSTARLGGLVLGHYIGESDLSSGPDRLARSYPADKFARLREIRTKRDPQARLHAFLGED